MPLYFTRVELCRYLRIHSAGLDPQDPARFGRARSWNPVTSGLAAGRALPTQTGAWLYAVMMPNLGLYLLYRIAPLLELSAAQHTVLWLSSASAAPMISTTPDTHWYAFSVSPKTKNATSR